MTWFDEVTRGYPQTAVRPDLDDDDDDDDVMFEFTLQWNAETGEWEVEAK